MQKIVRYLLVLVWVLQGGESLPGLVVAGSTDVHTSTKISEDLRQRLLADPARRDWLARHRIGITIQPYGPYHAVIVGPTRTPEVQNGLMITLASFGLHPFRVDASLKGWTPLVEAETRDNTRPILSPQHTVDWIWLAVFLLAVLGLIASIVQRKGLLRLAKGQKDVRDEQQRMDRELDGLQGEQRG